MQAMTESDKQFIQALIKGLEAKIDSIKDLFEEKISNIKYEVDKLRVDIIDLYDKSRGLTADINANENKVIKLESDMTNHKANHKENNNNKRSTIAIIVSIVSVAFAIIYSIIKGAA